MLSVITVCLNDLSALRHTFASIYENAVNNGVVFEWVVVDGGSDDGTVEFIERAKELSLCDIVFSTEKDDGIFDAFNKGANLASGVWVHYLNAGDLYVNPPRFSDPELDKIDFICFTVLKRKKAGDYLWYPKRLLNSEIVNVAHPGLICRRERLLKDPFEVSLFQFVGDSAFIWKNVLFKHSLILPIVLVDMADGGFSTSFKLRHEVEKQVLIWSSSHSLIDKIGLSIKYLCASFFRWFRIIN